MKRTNISLTDEQYDWLKKESFNEGVSMSKLFRRWIDNYLLLDDTLHISKDKKPFAKPPEKKPQKEFLAFCSDCGESVHSKEEWDKLHEHPYKTCKHGAKVGLCAKGCLDDCKHNKPKNLCKKCIK